MTIMSRITFGSLAAAAVFATAPAQATSVPGGTVSIVGLFNPTINLGASPNTFTATAGMTFEISGTGGFVGTSGGMGSLNGVLNFSTITGTTLGQSIANFFTFADGTGHNYQFSLNSVKTVNYASAPGISNSFSLFLLGNTVNSFFGYNPTPTSLTLTFNSTGVSAYAAAATLAVPPAVPEPATWAMALIGFGFTGAAMRRRHQAASVSFG